VTHRGFAQRALFWCCAEWLERASPLQESGCERRFADPLHWELVSSSVQEAPGGNPGTPGTNTTPPSMPDDGTQFPGSHPRRMAPGKACHPESPGFRRGLLVPFTRVKPRARAEERAPSQLATRPIRQRGAMARDPAAFATGFPPGAMAWLQRQRRRPWSGGLRLSKAGAAARARGHAAAARISWSAAASSGYWNTNPVSTATRGITRCDANSTWANSPNSSRRPK